MSGDELVALRLAFPFRPFTLVMADGRRLPVRRPTALGFSPDHSKIVYAPVTGGFDCFRAIDVSTAVVDEGAIVAPERSNPA